MDANSSKGLCIALLFIDTLLFGWPPYLLVRNNGTTNGTASRLRPIIISYLTCFAGGVFFGACILHLLSEGRNEMIHYFKERNLGDVDFPVFEIVVAIGFFLISLIEQIVHQYLSHSHQPRLPEQSSPHGTYGTIRDKPSSTNGDLQNDLGPQRGIVNPLHQKVVISTTAASGLNLAQSSSVTSFSSTDISVLVERETGKDTASEVSSNGHVGRESTVSYGAGSEGVVTIHSDTQLEDVHNHSKDEELARIAEIIEVNPLRAFLLLAALSFHTVFDGLAVGLQHESEDIWEMFIAICIHKSLVALCLGMQLFLVFKSRPIKAFIWIFVFSLISPLGVGLGIILTSGHMDKQAEMLVSWILQAVATGTFMYVTFFEILWEELIQKKGILRLLTVVIGFGGMAVAKYFDKD